MSLTGVQERLRKGVEVVVADPTLVKLITGGFAALLIKVGAAGLSFLMFVVLSRAMSAEDFGRFGFAFSLATLLAVVGSFGQRMMVLRFASIYDDRGDVPRLRGVVRTGYVVVTIGCGLLAVALATIALFWPGLPARSYLVATSVFLLILGLAEFQAHVLRAFGGMTLALLPRDILWRAAVIVAAIPSAFEVFRPLDASESLWMATGILGGMIVGQALLHPATRSASVVSLPADYDFTTWKRTALGLWGTSFVRTAAPNLAVVIIGLSFSAAETGAFFAALRVSMLLILFTMAVETACSPFIATYVEAGKVAQLQRLTYVATISSLIPTFASFVIFLSFGGAILQLFDPTFVESKLYLVILSSGYLVYAASGPNITILELSGHQDTVLRVLTISNLFALSSLVVLAPLIGTIAAAIILAVLNAAVGIWCGISVYQRVSIIPTSILAIAARNK